MTKTTFNTNPVPLKDLLRSCASGKIQLPDFQRSWVWEEPRISSLIASVSRGFPVGALMTLESKADGSTVFAKRPIEGTPNGSQFATPEQLLLDGQQRMTSLYQSCMRTEVVTTITPKRRLVKRWFYIDILKALSEEEDRESAIFTVPEDRKVKENFDKDVILDLSTRELEFKNLRFPLNQVFDWDSWQEDFGDYWIEQQDTSKRNLFKRFKNEVLENFKEYNVPVISLGADTSHEAVCLVFEKVNTGGKALDAFELLTAMYAAQGHKLRDDWLGTETKPGIKDRLSEYGKVAEQKSGVLSGVSSTDFLQAIALLHTSELRRTAMQDPTKNESDLPAVRAARQSLLGLPLSAYLKYKDVVEAGFRKAAKFLRQHGVYRVIDLPYQTQLVPMAAIYANIGERSEHASIQEKIARWFWCGIFGERYGFAPESRFAKDIMEVPEWLAGGPEPSTVRDGVLRAERLGTMRSRQSAAYKGIQALLLREGAQDFRTGQSYDTTVFFDEGVDIHHIFPRAWCEAQGIPATTYDTVINKSPLSDRTNRIIGGVAPSKYLSKLEEGRTGPKGGIAEPPIESSLVDAFLNSHLISPKHLRSDDFEGFITTRRDALLAMVSHVTGHKIRQEEPSIEEGEPLPRTLARDADPFMEPD